LGAIALVAAAVAGLGAGGAGAHSSRPGAKAAAHRCTPRHRCRPGCRSYCRVAGGNAEGVLDDPGTPSVAEMRHQWVRPSVDGVLTFRVQCRRRLSRCLGAVVVDGVFELGRSDMHVPAHTTRATSVALTERAQRYLARHPGINVSVTVFLEDAGPVEYGYLTILRPRAS
jgi:hypothetical protein